MRLYVPVTWETEAGGSLEHRSTRSPGHCNNPILHPSRKHAAGHVEVTRHSIEASPWILGSGCDLSGLQVKPNRTRDHVCEQKRYVLSAHWSPPPYLQMELSMHAGHRIPVILGVWELTGTKCTLYMKFILQGGWRCSPGKSGLPAGPGSKEGGKSS